MKVHVWGTRGSIAVPGARTLRYGGNTTCVEVDGSDGVKIVIDAGTGIRELGDAVVRRRGSVHMHLLVTHIHWDHILGFPFFAPIYRPDTQIVVDGNIRAYKGLKTLFENRMGDGFFPVAFDQLKANIRFLDALEKGSRHIGCMRVDRARLQHPGGGFGFRLWDEGRNKTLVFLTDNELREDAWDGCRPGDYVEFSRNADVLIHDCQYLEEEIEQRRGWGHSDHGSVLDLARRAEVRRLVLYHHDPARTDEEVDRLVERCRSWVDRTGAGFEVEGAREGTLEI